jgi:hypothetical protein
LAFPDFLVGNQNTVVIPHFIGAAPDSTNIRQSLSRLIREISLLFGLEAKSVPENFSDMQNMFKETLEKVGSLKDKGKRLILIIDALNQLDNTNHAHSLEWLPADLPTNVRLVVSTLEGDIFDGQPLPLE